MSCYFVAKIRITDYTEYQNYLNGTDQVFAEFNGKYLAVDQNPLALEGAWNHDRVVIIEFPDEGSLLNWYGSDAYQNILKHRLAGAYCETVLVHGL